MFLHMVFLFLAFNTSVTMYIEHERITINGRKEQKHQGE